MKFKDKRGSKRGNMYVFINDDSEAAQSATKNLIYS